MAYFVSMLQCVAVCVAACCRVLFIGESGFRERAGGRVSWRTS